jgi:hypothetical protein
MKKTIFYLCDGKRSCGSKPFCGMNNPCGDEDRCFHTTDVDHAINGPYSEKIDEDPRPLFVEDYEYEGFVWEGFIGNGKKKLDPKNF